MRESTCRTSEARRGRVNDLESSQKAGLRILGFTNLWRLMIRISWASWVTCCWWEIFWHDHGWRIQREEANDHYDCIEFEGFPLWSSQIIMHPACMRDVNHGGLRSGWETKCNSIWYSLNTRIYDVKIECAWHPITHVIEMKTGTMQKTTIIFSHEWKSKGMHETCYSSFNLITTDVTYGVLSSAGEWTEHTEG